MVQFKGHNSIGGFDIFYSVKNQAGEWDTLTTGVTLLILHGMNYFIILQFR